MKFIYCIAVIAIFLLNCVNTEASTGGFSDWNIPPPCHASDPVLNECLKQYYQIFWNKHANAYGSEKFKLPPLDPFTIAERKWSFKNPLYEFIFLTKNLKIYNMAETTIHKVKGKFNNTGKFSLELDMSDPEVIIESDFKVNLKIGELKIRQGGHFKLKIEKIHNYAKATGIIEKRENGYHYIKTKAVYFRPEIKDFKFEMRNNLENSAGIDTIVMDFFNNNVKDFYKDFIVATRPQWEPIILKVLNDFWSKFPVELMVSNE